MDVTHAAGQETALPLLAVGMNKAVYTPLWDATTARRPSASSATDATRPPSVVDPPTRGRPHPPGRRADTEQRDEAPGTLPTGAQR